MTTKINDLAVKTGEYTGADGKTKGRYENVGALMKSKDGSLFILLKRTFNPAGVEVDTGRDQVLISVFEPKEREQASPRAQAAAREAPAAAAAAAPQDDIPF